jgi:dihydrofolate reductase
MIADDEIHLHYSDLIKNSGPLLYGRITYQFMEYGRSVVENPTGNKAMDDFAVAINNAPKIVFSRSPGSVDWKNTELKREVVKEKILELKQQPGKDIFIGSPSLIGQRMNRPA